MKTSISLSITLAILVLTAAAEAASPRPMKVSVAGISFELPAGEWRRSDSGERVMFARGGGASGQSLAVWPMRTPAAAATFSMRQHARAYFASERAAPRSEKETWQDFTEATVIAGGQEHYALRYRTTMRDPAVKWALDGQLVLYFPSDFARTQVFYTFMWINGHARDEAPDRGDTTALVHALTTATPPALPAIDLQLERAMGLMAPSLDTTPRGVEIGRSMAARALGMSQSPEQIASLMRFSDEQGVKRLELRIDAAPGERFHVLQAAGNLYDEWINIGNEGYRNAGLWFPTPEKSREADAATNRFSSPEKYVILMQQGEPVASGEVESGGRRYGVIEYRQVLGPGFSPTLRVAPEPAQVRIWIDSLTGLLAKAEITGNGDNGQPFRLEQTYAGQGIAVRIEAPAKVLPIQP